MPARPASHKVIERRFKQHSSELKKLSEISNPTAAPIFVDRSNLCRECKRRGTRKNCQKCREIAEQRERVKEALSAEKFIHQH